MPHDCTKCDATFKTPQELSLHNSSHVSRAHTETMQVARQRLDSMKERPEVSQASATSQAPIAPSSRSSRWHGFKNALRALWHFFFKRPVG